MMSEAARYYHTNNIKTTFNKDASTDRNPKYSDDIWASLMTEAILSFSDGLENKLEPITTKTALNLYNSAANIAGDEAFNAIAYLVASNGVKLSQLGVDPLGQASTLFLEAQNLSQDTSAMEQGRTDPSTGYTRIWEIQQELQKLGIDYKELAEQIGGYAAEVQELLNALTAYSPQTGAGGGTGMTGLPTGVQFQE